jgi:hypothetical protein
VEQGWSVANAVSAIKATGIFPLDQNATSNNHFFSICYAPETGEATEPDCSEPPVTEHSS